MGKKWVTWRHVGLWELTAQLTLRKRPNISLIEEEKLRRTINNENIKLTATLN